MTGKGSGPRLGLWQGFVENRDQQDWVVWCEKIFADDVDVAVVEDDSSEEHRAE